jgi:uncharacterized membrane protein
MAKDSSQNRLLSWGTWFSGIAVVGFMAADVIVRPSAAWLGMMPVYCLAAFALLHSMTLLGLRRSLWFLVLGLVLSYIAEYLGTNFGAIFGSQWFMRSRDLQISVGAVLPGRVPLTAVLTWYGLLYVTFTASVHLLKARPTDVSAFAAVPLSAGLMMALWQLPAAPVALVRHIMGFAQNGYYHGVPLSSFIGWFATAVFVVLFFIVVEPGAADASLQAEPGHRITPLVLAMYGACVLYPSVICFRANMTGAGWLGITVMLLFALALVARSREAQPAAVLTPAKDATS